MNNRAIAFLVIVLFLLKCLSVYLTSFNLFGDEAQYWLWSEDLDFGYFSKPPFLAWVIRAHTSVFGSSFFCLKLLPIFAYFLTALAVFSLCLNIGLDKNKAVSCSLIFLFIPAVSFSSFVISTDIFLLLFWTLSLNELVKIEKSSGLKNFILLGVFLGLAFLSKYAAIYFIVCLVVYVVVDFKFRNIFLKKYYLFLLSFIITFFILLPNIIWNINNGWVTLQHTSDNANFSNIKINLLRGFEFIVIQFLMVGPFIVLGNWYRLKNLKFIGSQKILLVFSLPIFVIVFIEAVIVRANANWAAPALISIFIYLFIGLDKKIFSNLNILFNFVFCFIFFLLICTNYPLKIFERINGINKFSKDVYFERLDSDVNNFVISDRLLYASMSYELRDKSLNFYMPYKKGLLITNHFMISAPLKKDINDSFILVGSPNEINYLENNFSIIEKRVPAYNFTNREIEIYEVNFN